MKPIEVDKDESAKKKVSGLYGLLPKSPIREYLKI